MSDDSSLVVSLKRFGASILLALVLAVALFWFQWYQGFLTIDLLEMVGNGRLGWVKIPQNGWLNAYLIPCLFFVGLFSSFWALAKHKISTILPALFFPLCYLALIVVIALH